MKLVNNAGSLLPSYEMTTGTLRFADTTGQAQRLVGGPGGAYFDARSPISLDAIPVGTGFGQAIFFGGGATVAGGLYYLSVAAVWTPTNATAFGAGLDGNLLAVALGPNPLVNGMLVDGWFRFGAVDGAFVPGAPMWMSAATAGRVTFTAPALPRVIGTGGPVANVCRIIPDSGANLTADVMNIRILAGSGALLANDEHITVTATGTLTLDAVPLLGRNVHVARRYAGLDYTIDGNGNNIIGAATLVLNANYQSVHLVWDGVQWCVD